MNKLKNETRKIKRPLSLILAVIMFLSICLSVDIPKGVNAAYYKTYTSMGSYRFADDNYGYYMVPDQPGKYPVLFLFHGANENYQSADIYKNNALATLNKWIALGYMDPMIVIMPEIKMKSTEDPWAIKENKKFVTEGRFGMLLDKLKLNNGGFNTEVDAKVDTTKKFSVSGLSMGGATCLLAGSEFSDDVINVGSASPAWCFYHVTNGVEDGWVKKSQIHFSKDSNAHFMFGNGVAENDYKINVDTYQKAFKEVKVEGQKDFVRYSTYPAGHDWVTFKREIFYFLYYVKYDKVPSDEIIEEACKNTNLDYEPYVPSYDFDLKTVSSDMTVDHKSKYTLSVEATGSNIQNISYEWQYAIQEAPNKWSKSEHTKNSPTLEVPSATRDILYRCVVKNGDMTKTSKTITVKVRPLVTSIKSSLTDGKVEEGKEFTISVTAEGQELKYQWQSSSDNKNWTSLSGKTSATLKTVGGKAGSTTYYRCNVTSYSQTVSKDIAIKTIGNKEEQKTSEQATSEETKTTEEQATTEEQKTSEQSTTEETKNSEVQKTTTTTVEQKTDKEPAKSAKTETTTAEVKTAEYQNTEDITKDKLKKNLLVADKKSGGKFKVTKVTKKKGEIVGGTVSYMAPYDKNCKKATAPDYVKIAGVKFKVTEINKNAFKNCKKLKSFCVGKNVTKIGNEAFRGCSNLKSVTIKSKKLTKIGSKAFSGINKNAKFKVPKDKLFNLAKKIKAAKAPKSVKVID